MTRRANTTDTPTSLVEDCLHRTPHRHGTNAAYQHCACRCEACGDAARRYKTARAHTGKGGPEPIASRFTKGKEPYSPLTDYTIKPSEPVTNAHTAKLAARTVLHHCGNPDAREVLDMLGLSPILRGVR